MLKLEFANSHISKFTALVDVNFSHLFWSKAHHTEPVRLIGSYESCPAAPKDTPGAKKAEDVFSLRTAKDFTIDLDGFLAKVIISRAELVVTSTEKDPQGNLVHLTSFLGFNAELKFKNASIGSLLEVEKITVDRLGLEYTQKGDDLPASLRRITSEPRLTWVSRAIRCCRFCLLNSQGSALRLMS